MKIFLKIFMLLAVLAPMPLLVARAGDLTASPPKPSEPLQNKPSAKGFENWKPGELRMIQLDLSGPASKTPDQVQQEIDAMGAKTWTPDEGPNRLEELINGKVAQNQNDVRRDIKNCLTIDDINAKYDKSTLKIVAVVKNVCPETISYFAKFQLVGADNFPLTAEMQNNYTQIAGKATRNELGMMQEALDTPPTKVIVQITSFDHPAYGTLSKEQALKLPLPPKNPPQKTEITPETLDFAKCFSMHSIKTKFFTDKVQSEKANESNDGQGETQNLSVIIKLYNKCIKNKNLLEIITENPNEKNKRAMIQQLETIRTHYYFVDKDSFAISNGTPISNDFVESGSYAVQKAVIPIPNWIFKNRAETGVVFNVQRGYDNKDVIQRSVPLSKPVEIFEDDRTDPEHP